MVMKMPLRQTTKQYTVCLLVLCFFLISLPVYGLSAQNTETGSTTKKTNAKTGMELPLESEQEQHNPNKKEKDNRPRELGVMVLILWLLAGTGIGILIFTSLFGHSVRSMVRRPYPQQTQTEQQIPSEAPPENHDASEQINEGPTNS